MQQIPMIILTKGRNIDHFYRFGFWPVRVSVTILSPCTTLKRAICLCVDISGKTKVHQSLFM